MRMDEIALLDIFEFGFYDHGPGDGRVKIRYEPVVSFNILDVRNLLKLIVGKPVGNAVQFEDICV